jgi:hypothetical protein
VNSPFFPYLVSITDEGAESLVWHFYRRGSLGRQNWKLCLTHTEQRRTLKITEVWGFLVRPTLGTYFITEWSPGSLIVGLFLHLSKHPAVWALTLYTKRLLVKVVTVFSAHWSHFVIEIKSEVVYKFVNLFLVYFEVVFHIRMQPKGSLI